MVKKEVLDYYSQPGMMTSVGKYQELVAKLPDDVAGLMKVIQGLVIYEHVASAFYGFKIPGDRLWESHIRRVDRMLDRILELSDKPLTTARPPEKRLVGVCHHYTILLVAMLRAKGIPARARWGFAAYFNPNFYEDHVLCEYWDSDEKRWKLADPQFDEVWRAQRKIAHDIVDVPRDRFIITHDAWERWRAGLSDPSKFGIAWGNLRGLWFIADSLVRDAASLNKMEMLMWDGWGGMVAPDENVPDDKLDFFDRLAALTRNPDASFEDIQAFYQADERLRVPPVVFNSLLVNEEEV